MARECFTVAPECLAQAGYDIIDGQCREWSATCYALPSPGVMQQPLRPIVSPGDL
jgi:hypothetical protein